MKKVFVFLLFIVFAVGCSLNLKNKENNNSLKKDYIVGILDDNLYSDSKFIDSLIDDLNTKFNIHAKKLTIDETEHFDLEDANVIFGIGLNMDNYIGVLAKKNPERKFFLMDSALDLRIENLHYINFDLDEASFLTGMILSKCSNNKLLGYLGATETDIIKNSYYSFCAGAKYETIKDSRDVGINLKYLNSFHDSNDIKRVCDEFLIENVDSLFSHLCGLDDSLLKNLNDDVFISTISDYLSSVDSDLVIKKDYSYAINDIILNNLNENKIFNLKNKGVNVILNESVNCNLDSLNEELNKLLKDENFFIPNTEEEYNLFIKKFEK